jgi:methylamine dehydrogenase accessory protein MauD
MFLLLLVVVLIRQIGLLHRRFAPTGARMINSGPEIGDQAPEVEGISLRGQRLRVGGARAKQLLLMFVSPACSNCKKIMPAILSLQKSERATLDIMLVTLTSDETSNREFAAQHGLINIPYIISGDIGLQYKVLLSPYGVLIDREGRVQSKGIVNNFEHLESLLNAADIGQGSFDSWMRESKAPLVALNES